jgi:hypothetical protein
MEKIVSLIYNKEKTSNAFFGKNVNKSVHFFVYGFRLTFYANYSVQTCNVMVAPQWKSNISGDVTIVWFSEV